MQVRAARSRFMWYCRTRPAVAAAFAQIWSEKHGLVAKRPKTAPGTHRQKEGQRETDDERRDCSNRMNYVDLVQRVPMCISLSNLVWIKPGMNIQKFLKASGCISRTVTVPPFVWRRSEEPENMITSFDGCAVFRPLTRHPEWRTGDGRWFHVDQHPSNKGSTTVHQTEEKTHSLFCSGLLVRAEILILARSRSS